MNDVKESRAYKYCEWALKKNNDMVPHYVKLQCESWKNIVDGKEPSIYVSKSTYKKIMTILHFMIHPDLKKPLDESLEDYAMFFIIAVFCTKMIAGYECVEIKQHSSVLHMPTKWLKECILSERFFYDENLMLEINFQNARCTEDTNRNKYVNKKKSVDKVDQVVGNINSTYLIEQELLYGADDFLIQT